MTSTPTYMGSGDPARRQPYYPWWLDKLADDVTGEGAFMEGAAQGAEAVRSIVTYARTVNEYQEFHFTGDYGDNGFLEDYTTHFHGQPAGVVVTVIRNASYHRELSMRNDVPPFTNKYARQAIAYTLDRPAIIQALFHGYAEVGNDTPFVPAFPATVGPPAIPQRSKNLRLAKELLAKAGVPNGFSTPLVTEALGEIPDFAQIIKQSARQIGVDINLTIETSSKYYGKAVFGKSDWLDGEMSLADYGARAAPNIFLQAPLQSINAKAGQGSWNAARFSNPTYDKLSKKFTATPDLTTQRQLAKQIELLLLDETPIIYAYSYEWLTATQKNVTGVYPALTGLFLWNAAKT